MDRRPRAVDVVTLPYPGFPTDLQPMVLALNAVAEGAAMVTENVFEARFMFVDELVRLGADVRTDGHHAVVRGREQLSAAPVRATDIRAGAGLVVAALVCRGRDDGERCLPRRPRLSGVRRGDARARRRRDAGSPTPSPDLSRRRRPDPASTLRARSPSCGEDHDPGSVLRHHEVGLDARRLQAAAEHLALDVAAGRGHRDQQAVLGLGARACWGGPTSELPGAYAQRRNRASPPTTNSTRTGPTM